MKKRIIQISIFIVLILFGTFFLVKNNNKTNMKKDTLYEFIQKEIDKKENLLIFLKNTKTTSETSADAQQVIKFYEKEYNLDFYTIDIKNVKQEQYLELLSNLGIKEDDVNVPSVIFIKNKELAGVANSVHLETPLKDFLIKFQFIEEGLSSIDNILDLENFEKKLKASEKSLIAFYTNDSNGYSFRKILLALSKKYNFNYDITYPNISYGFTIYQTVMLLLKKDIEIPALVIIKNNKVIDYISTTNEKEIFNFLKENEML